MNQDEIKQFARRFWPDADQTFDNPDCIAYYQRQYRLWLRRQTLKAA